MMVSGQVEQVLFFRYTSTALPISLLLARQSKASSKAVGLYLGDKLMKHKVGIALYGNVGIERGYCKACGTNAFIKNGRLTCCGAPINGEPKKFYRECEAPQGRRTPPAAEKRRILEEQENRCFYCGLSFDDHNYRRSLPVKLKLHWDHQLPYSYSQNNKTANFVASCHICNGIKSNKLFQTVEEAQVFIQSRRKLKGYEI